MNSTLLPLPFSANRDGFIRSLVAKNRTPATLTSYRSDVTSFLVWLCENTPCTDPQEVSRADVTEYLAERGQAGVHPKVVSERLGHGSVSITLDTYSHVLPGLQEEAAGLLDRYLKQADPAGWLANR